MTYSMTTPVGGKVGEKGPGREEGRKGSDLQNFPGLAAALYTATVVLNCDECQT